MAEPSKVLVGKAKDSYIIKVDGKGTMEFCSDLFMYLSEKIETEKVDDVYFELSSATYLDSSFIGIIISVQKKLKKKSKESDVIILNPSEKVKEILSNMGLLEIIPLQEGEKFKNISLTEEIEKKLEKNYKSIKLLLESHQNLMELTPENKKRFALVEELLKKELERNKND
ncbi:MAG: STAS domain-containing protein [Brevinematia bacterium]